MPCALRRASLATATCGSKATRTFAFLVPEPAFEDTELVEAMVQAGLLTERFVACLTMTDFPNPVFSERRAALLRYVPEDARRERRRGHGEPIRCCGASRGRAGATAPQAGSPEREFLANWDTADYEATFSRRITDYFRALKAGMANPDVVDGWFRLAEYRRRRFRARPLAEFALTTPRTNIPDDAPALRMTRRAASRPFPTAPSCLTLKGGIRDPFRSARISR